jgi:ESS family glutamate:Na+ symporter
VQHDTDGIIRAQYTTLKVKSHTDRRSSREKKTQITSYLQVIRQQLILSENVVIINLDMVQSLAFAVIILLAGRFLKMRIALFKQFCIPSPVIGGTAFALFTLVLKTSGTLEFDFTTTLQGVLMTAFFTTVGFSASFKVLKTGGTKVSIFLTLAIILVFLQNVIGVGFARVFHINPLIGLSTGSVPLTGGHGTSGAFAPIFESAGAVGATAVAMATATFGLIAGSMLGGPIGKRLIDKNRLLQKMETLEQNIPAPVIPERKKTLLNSECFFEGACQVILAMGFGSVISLLLQYTGIKFPPYLGAMFAAAIFRNVSDCTGMIKLRSDEISVIGDTSLALFVAMALMNLKLWMLAELAGPVIAILIAQTVLMAAFAYYITFNVMGRNYEAAVMACGHCGFGMGATPNAMVNMSTLTKQYTAAPTAFFVIPLVGSLFIDFFNAGIITIFINFFD